MRGEIGALKTNYPLLRLEIIDVKGRRYKKEQLVNRPMMIWEHFCLTPSRMDNTLCGYSIRRWIFWSGWWRLVRASL